MTKRLIVLLAILVLGFGATFAIPTNLRIRQTALPGSKLARKEFGDMNLPPLIGKYVAGPPLPAGELERAVLAQDTGFSKRQYSRRNFDLRQTDEQGQPTGDMELVTASVVTAGSDMGNSIHRPERCMTAQGHNLEPSKTLVFEGKNGVRIPVTKIISNKPVELQLTNGEKQVVNRRGALYYWFVGTDRITSNHLHRTLWDLADRLKTGTDQEWAYASISIPLDDQVTELENPEKDAERSKLRNKLLAELHTKNPKADVRDLPKEWDKDISHEWIRVRSLKDDAVNERGLTQVDLLAEEFIADFVAEVVDEKQIKAWGN
jgi:hypothetical protein